MSCLHPPVALSLAERRRAHSANHAGLEVDEHRAWYVLAARSLEVKHVNAVELRVVVAAFLAVAANALLVAQYLLKLGAHLVTHWPARMCAISREQTACRRGASGRKRTGRSGET